ncbi:MAG: hypothetical protein Q8M16_15825 [Pirellulaceae bacterium]|nr:hypothetical protein [Pirellulaceae bacterium]
MFDKSDPRLIAYLLGELDEAEAKLVSEALLSNQELQAELQQLQAVVSQVQNVFESELQTTPSLGHVSIGDPPSDI